MLWDFSTAAGKLGLAVLVLAGLVVLLSSSAEIRRRAATIIPRQVVDFFSTPSQADPADMARESALIEELKNSLRKAKPAQRHQSSATFTVGSTKEDVLAAQGMPSKATEAVWVYGDSEVYFAAGRVVSWRNSAKNPLKIR